MNVVNTRVVSSHKQLIMHVSRQPKIFHFQTLIVRYCAVLRAKFKMIVVIKRHKNKVLFLFFLLIYHHS